MSPTELLVMAEKHAADGQNVLVLRRPATKGRRYKMTAALLPGLNGHILAHDGDSLTLVVDVDRVVAWCKRRGVSAPPSGDAT